MSKEERVDKYIETCPNCGVIFNKMVVEYVVGCFVCPCCKHEIENKKEG